MYILVLTALCRKRKPQDHLRHWTPRGLDDSLISFELLDDQVVVLSVGQSKASNGLRSPTVVEKLSSTVLSLHLVTGSRMRRLGTR